MRLHDLHHNTLLCLHYSEDAIITQVAPTTAQCLLLFLNINCSVADCCLLHEDTTRSDYALKIKTTTTTKVGCRCWKHTSHLQHTTAHKHTRLDTCTRAKFKVHQLHAYVREDWGDARCDLWPNEAQCQVSDEACPPVNVHFRTSAQCKQTNGRS